MLLRIPVSGIVCRVDYVSRIGGRELTPLETAMEAAAALNFKVRSASLRGAVIVLSVEHGGDADVCAGWLGEKLGVAVQVDRRG